MKNICIVKGIILSLLVTLSVNAQSQINNTNLNSQLPTIIPPSPASQAFMRYGENPPSLATGTVNLSIPIYNLQLNNFSMPITMSYATNGIKLYDSPYPVGFGWSLQAAFRITRTIIGKPDEYYNRNIKSENEILSMSKGDRYKYQRQIMADIYDGVSKDGEQDVFSVSLPNENFSFFIQGDAYGNHTAITVGTDAKVTVKKQYITNMYSPILYFEIIDSKGVKYVFGEVSSNPESYPLETAKHLLYDCGTAWGLTKIIPQGGEGIINFKWKSVDTPYLYLRTQGFIDALEDCQAYTNNYTPPPTTNIFRDSKTYLFSYNKIMQLDKIEFPAGYIDFYYKRFDEIHGSLLEKIEIKENTFNTVIKKAEFVRDLGKESVLLKELKLSGEGTYTFEYDPTRFDHEYAQDFWGFYNKELNNKTLNPVVKIKAYIGNPSRAGFSTKIETLGNANRKVNETYMQAYMLKKVIYPTRGYSTFEYEAHQFQGRTPYGQGISDEYKVPFTMGGGLRLKKMENKASALSISETKTYKYGKNEDGKGKVIAEPTIDTFIDETAGYKRIYMGTSNDKTHFSYRTVTLKSHSTYNEFLYFDTPVWYDQVTEYNNEHKTTYLYENTTSPQYYPKPYFDFQLYFWSISNKQTVSYPFKLNTIGTPSLKEKIVYLYKNAEYKPVAKYKYEYGMTSYKVSNVHVRQPYINNDTMDPGREGGFLTFNYKTNDVEQAPLTSGFYPFQFFSSFFLSAVYEIEIAKNYPTKETNIQYTGNDSIMQITNYEYKNQNNNSVIITKNISTSKDYFKEEYKYPLDFMAADNIYAEMSTKYNISPIIETTVSNNDKTVSKVKTNYDKFGTNLFLPKNVETTYQDSNTVSEITYNRYDSRGNLVQYTGKDEINVIYIWGYNYQYPVAEIKGATYTEVKDAIGKEPELISNNGEEIIGRIDIRSKLPHALITTFIYKSLVGTTSVTDPRGIAIYYDYDSFGRLKRTYMKDTDNVERVIGTYDYNYRNE